MQPQLERKQNDEQPVSVSGSQLPSTEYHEPMPEFEDSADLRDYLDVVLRRKWLILSILLISFVTTLIVSLTMKPVFKAAGRLELTPNIPNVTKFEGITDVSLQNKEFLQTQVNLLRSPSLAQRVIEKSKLEQYSVFGQASGKEDNEPVSIWKRAFQSIEETLKGWLGAGQQGNAVTDSDILRLRRQKKAESWFLDNLEVQAERDTSLVSLAFSSTDPRLARDIINHLINEFIDWQMDKRIDAANAAKQQLEKQIGQSRIRLEKSENALNQFAQKAGIVSLDSKLNLVYRELEEFNSALPAAEADRISKEALYKQLQKSAPGSLSLVLGNTLIQNLREEYIKHQAEYEELHAVFKDGYPKLKTVKARMKDIQQRIAKEEARIAESIENDYLAALQKEKDLRAKAVEKKNLAMELNGQTTQYKILEREVETNKQIYQSLLERGKEIDANVGTDLGNIQVVDYAQLPLSPYKPNVRKNLLLAVVVGLMGGIGLAFFLEYLDNTVKGIDEISDRFQIPVLGVLPLAEAEDVPDLDRLVQVNPRSSFAESVRTTKTAIELSGFMDQSFRSILITSTTGGEGKSTIANNLAQAFASSEKRVLLIDADLRKPRLHKVYKSNGDMKGLSHFLSGMCQFHEAVRKTDIPNLYFVPAGLVPPNPAQLLGSGRAKKLLKKLADYFDLIVVDGPPFAGLADALVLGNAVDGVLLVCTLGQTHREALRILRRSLYNVQGCLLGSVINKLSVSRHYGRYYKYYHYYHYYNSYEREAEQIPMQPTETVQPDKRFL